MPTVVQTLALRMAENIFMISNEISSFRDLTWVVVHMTMLPCIHVAIWARSNCEFITIKWFKLCIKIEMNYSILCHEVNIWVIDSINAQQ